MEGNPDRIMLDYVVVKDSEGWFIATIPALPGCCTASKNRNEIPRKVKEAAAMHLEHFVQMKGIAEFIGLERVVL